MDPAAQLECFQADCRRLAAAARRDLTIPIPFCPGWTMSDLVAHTSGGHRFTEARIRRWSEGDPEFYEEPTPKPPAGADLLEWFEAGASQLVQTLVDLDPCDRAGEAMWHAIPSPAFRSLSLYRHHSRETGIHRWDAERSLGLPTSVDDDFAADWLDDLLDSWLTFAADTHRQAQSGWTGESFHFHRTDAEGEWTVIFRSRSSVMVTREHSSADVNVQGPASALLLLALNRIEVDDSTLEASGELQLFHRWAQDVRYGSSAR